MKHNIIIVGAGLFGSIAATLARAQGHRVTVVDNAAPWGASKASGCVLAPSWLSSLSKPDIATAMAVLNELYKVHPLELHSSVAGVGLHKIFKAARVDPDKVLVKPDIVESVSSLSPGTVHLARGKLRGKVLVAAGMGCHGLLPGLPPMKGLWGASVRFRAQIPNDLINVYAPYRQAVMFNFNPRTVWGGDGTALIRKTWEAEGDARQQVTLDRLRRVADFPSKTPGEIRVGARPYVEGHKSGFFAKVADNTWVSTGGAKNGTVLAALQAWKFVMEELK